jgi:N-acetylmuramoyl-L-alanine amidase
MGFISNESDRRLLLDNKHLDEIVELITKGIIDYFNADR